MDGVTRKYFKPHSLTWWAGIGALAAGAFKAAGAALPMLAPAEAALDALTGSLPASAMVDFGLGLIGIRGALHDLGAH